MVRLALENNLGIQVARLNPQIEDLSVAAARAGWTPAFTSTFESANTETPSTSFLSGGQSGINDRRVTGNVGVQQALPWGGNYSFGWDSSRATTTNNFSNFSPQLRSSMSLHVQQPLLRNFGIDSLREDVGFVPEVRFPAAVAETFEWFQRERVAEHTSFDFSFEDEMVRLVRERSG